MSNPSLVWFRRDLRLADNPALSAAIGRGKPVIPVFICSPEEDGDFAPGGASRWWLHHSLESLRHQLGQLDSRLIIRQGTAQQELFELARVTSADAVYWNRCYEPASIARDSRIKSELRTLGLEAESFNGSLLFEPWDVQTKDNRPYQVFTSFWKSCLAQGDQPESLPAPRHLPAPTHWPQTHALERLELLPRIHWDAGLRSAWKPGATGADQELRRFLASAMTDYETARDFPGLAGTSRLSPHLHFGEISPRSIWHAVIEAKRPQSSDGAETFLKELGWREFAHHLLYHFPRTTTEPLRPEFSQFPWRTDAAGLRAWQRGQTGFPIVDAGMRELWTTGWMHNRVRMIVASFLIKDLLLPWQHGAAWFWDTLVDADLANNTLGWQWTAGCGADAAPYFRVFNPVLQSEKFDPDGVYLRRWVPELAALPNRSIHAPWKVPERELNQCGIELGKTYPHPIVDHDEARRRALSAFQHLKSS